jgi:hypothetical protein
MRHSNHTNVKIITRTSKSRRRQRCRTGPNRSKVGLHLPELARRYSYPSSRVALKPSMKTRRQQSQLEGKPVRKIAMRHNRNTASVPKHAAIASGCITAPSNTKTPQSSVANASFGASAVFSSTRYEHAYRGPLPALAMKTSPRR